MFVTDRRVYRTTDGRLVEEDDPRAAFLAYPEGAEVADEEARRVGLAAFAEKAGSKARAKLADKAVARPPDKGGLTINRARKEA